MSLLQPFGVEIIYISNNDPYLYIPYIPNKDEE